MLITGREGGWGKVITWVVGEGVGARGKKVGPKVGWEGREVGCDDGWPVQREHERG